MKLSALNEQPMITFPTKEKMWEKLTKILRNKNITFEYFDKTSIPDIHRYDDLGESLYIHYTEKDGITAYMFFSQNTIHHKGKKYVVMQQKDTLNHKNIFKNFTLTIFKEMNKYYGMPILCDDRNSYSMMGVFNHWLNNSEKIGLKNFFIYDAKTKKTLVDSSELEHEMWDKDLSGKRYTLLFDFFDTLKEDKDDYNARFKGTQLESKLYYSGPKYTPPDTTFT